MKLKGPKFLHNGKLMNKTDKNKDGDKKKYQCPLCTTDVSLLSLWGGRVHVQ